MLMKKVLLATDFSPPAQELVACLAELKAQGMEEVILFHAVSVVRAQGSALEVQRYYEERLEKEKDRLDNSCLFCIYNHNYGWCNLIYDERTRTK